METKINTKLIENYMYDNNLSKKEFCKLCELSQAILRKILRNQKNYRITALFKVAKLLKAHICDLFIKA